MVQDIKERYINPLTGTDKFFEQAEIAKYSAEERQEYEASVKDYRDYINTIDTAHEKGWKEGMAEGREKGLAEGMEKGVEEGIRGTARKMKSKGYALEDIVEITGLTIAEIEAL